MRRLSALALAAAFAGCPRPAPPDPAFAAEWQRWHEGRVARLKVEDGWLALSGLHWLEPGENRVPGLPGLFRVEGGAVTLEAAPADGWLFAGQPVTRRRLQSDASGAPDKLKLPPGRTAAVIERGGRLALRTWDANSPARTGFQGIPAFPADPRWRVVARWEAYPAPKQVLTPNVLGAPTLEAVPGRAVFTLEGKELSLEPTQERPGDPLFFVFKDATAKDATYGAGRFLYAEPPEDGRVTLDFNRTYNPPCAFTPHATCPLPRAENVLAVRVEAGEMRAGGH